MSDSFATIWLKYCRRGVKQQSINQPIPVSETLIESVNFRKKFPSLYMLILYLMWGIIGTSLFMAVIAAAGVSQHMETLFLFFLKYSLLTLVQIVMLFSFKKYCLAFPIAIRIAATAELGPLVNSWKKSSHVKILAKLESNEWLNLVGHSQKCIRWPCLP